MHNIRILHLGDENTLAHPGLPATSLCGLGGKGAWLGWGRGSVCQDSEGGGHAPLPPQCVRPVGLGTENTLLRSDNIYQYSASD